MSNAFASLLQARPSPAFGRPVHLRGSPLDYGPVLLLMPFEFHLAMDTLPSGVLLSGGFRSVLICFRLSPLCPFRRRHTFYSLRPATHYRRFWIQRPSSERWRDLNPPDQRAAQRKVNARRFHRHRLHSALCQPISEGVKVLSACRKRAYFLGCTIRRYGDEDFCRADVNPGRVRPHHREHRILLFGVFLALPCHRPLLLPTDDGPGRAKRALF